MNVALPKPMSLAEFLEWEEKQKLRYEFDGFQPVARTGGPVGHACIQTNLATSIVGRLRGRPCEFFGSNLKIQVAGDHIRYPDSFVTCSPCDNKSTVVTNPVVIFEVLSQTTGSTDRIVKALEYQATPSVLRYVMLEQDCAGATVYARIDGEWTVHVLLEDDILSMPEIGVELPLAELYQSLVFDEQDDSDELPQPE